MDCPKCNSEMVLGYIQSANGVIWTAKEHKLLIVPNEKKGDVWVGGEDNSFGALIEAFRCLECRTIVIPPSIETLIE